MRRKNAIIMAISYFIYIALIVKNNPCNGLLVRPSSSLLLPQRRYVLSMNVIDEESAEEIMNRNVALLGEDNTCNGDLCLLIDDDDCFHDINGDYEKPKAEEYEKRWWNLLNLNDDQEQGTIVVDTLLILLPVVVPLIGYFAYEPIAAVFAFVIDYLSNKSWVSVDGRQLQTQVITPAINGIIVNSVAILFANMISITISTLRQRQLVILTALNVESNEMRSLHSLLAAFPTDDIPSAKEAQYRCQRYLWLYTTRVIAESKPGVSNTILQYSGSMESEMNGLYEQLNIIDATSSQIMPSSNLLPQLYSTVTRINTNRIERLSALQSTFPPLHYAILTALSGSILAVFLMETNQELLYFLSAVEIRILWTILVGTFASLAVVLYDLSDPFRGSYQIRRSADQLYSLRASFKTGCNED